jgi:hypothetical protein
MNLLTANLLLIATIVGKGFAVQPQALVYRGPAACDGCPEAVAHLLRTSPSQFNVTFVGPNEDVDITNQSLGQADAYCQPGGGGKSLIIHMNCTESQSLESRADLAQTLRHLGRR